MTAVLTVYCDKCGGPVEADRHQLLVASGSLRQRRAEGVDLCSTCFAAFDQWLAQRPVGHVPTPVRGCSGSPAC
jgi:hypothetical protein